MHNYRLIPPFLGSTAGGPRKKVPETNGTDIVVIIHLGSMIATVVFRDRALEEPFGWSAPTRSRAMVEHGAALESLQACLC